MEIAFNFLSREINKLCKKYKDFITEDLIRFLFIKSLCKHSSVSSKDIYIERPYLIKPGSISQKGERWKGIIEKGDPLRNWLKDKSRLRLDLFFEKEATNYCIEFKRLKYGKGWAPHTRFGGTINDLHRLSLLKQYDINFKCYFICAYDDRYQQYFKDKYIPSTFLFYNTEGMDTKATEVLDVIENLSEIKKNSQNSFSNKISINYPTDFKNDILQGIDYKIVKRFTRKDVNIVLIEITKT